MGNEPVDSKAALRTRFRQIRRGLDDRSPRSDRIWRFLTTLPEYETSTSVMLFDSVPGEPETVLWKADATASGRAVFVPEQDDLPRELDLVVVPGLAFTITGDRLGQGGGWYDRFLAETRARALVGVCFDVQIVADLPTEPHDVGMTHVVTDRGIYGETDTSR